MKKNKYTTAPLFSWDIFMNGIDKHVINIPIGGFQKQSLIDYPGNVSAVVFTCGCNFRCNYCHNPELVYPDLISEIKNQKSYPIIEWLTKNQNLLDAVVITGGEPTLHPSLPTFISRIKSLGLKIKLDTNGTNPLMLKSLILAEQIDYIAMDIKAPLLLDKYRQVVGSGFNKQQMNKVITSVDLLNTSPINCEFRTTLYENISVNDIQLIIDKISREYYIQALRKNGVALTKDSFLSALMNLVNRNSKTRILIR